MTEFKYQWAAGKWNGSDWTIDMLFKGDELQEASKWANEYDLDLLVRGEDDGWESLDHEYL